MRRFSFKTRDFSRTSDSWGQQRLSHFPLPVCVPAGHVFFYQELLLGQPPPLCRPRVAASFWKQTLGWLPDFNSQVQDSTVAYLTLWLAWENIQCKSFLIFYPAKEAGTITWLKSTELQGRDKAVSTRKVKKIVLKEIIKRETNIIVFQNIGDQNGYDLSPVYTSLILIPRRGKIGSH